MIKSISFFDEITVWWDRGEFSGAREFSVFANGKQALITDKTHITLGDLCPDSEYKIDMYGLSGGKVVCEKSLRVFTQMPKKRIDVTAAPYFAAGDGRTLDTAAIQAAVDACEKDEYLYFPAGVFLTGALELKSDLEIYVSEQATIQGVADLSGYLPMRPSRFEGVERNCYRSLLNFGKMDGRGGYTSRNLIIRGKGKILGGGRELFNAALDKPGVIYDENGPQNTAAVEAWRSRGRLLEVCNAQNVVVCGLTMGMSASWNLHFIYSKEITTYNCKIISQGINNGDGWDPDSCEDCAIFACEFFTGDDLIAIKSGKNPEGNIIGRPCENIYIFDCKSMGGHGMSLGSEISGGIKNVFVWDCDFSDCWYGFQIKATKKRGAYVKNVYVSNCKLSCVLIWAVGYNDDGEGVSAVPVFEDFHFKDITVTGTDYFIKVKTSAHKRYIFIRGFDEAHPVKKVNFSGVTLLKEDKNAPGIETEFVSDITFKNVTDKTVG